MKKINKSLIKGLALTLGACSLVPLAACGKNDDGNKSTIWFNETGYAYAQEKLGFTGTFEEYIQMMTNVKGIRNEDGNLIFVLGDGTEVNFGKINGKGIKSVTSVHDDEANKTVVTITYTDDTQSTFDIPDAEAGKDGEKGEKGEKGDPGRQGEKGDPGVGIAKVEADENNDRWGIVSKFNITYTNGTVFVLDNSKISPNRKYDATTLEEFDYLINHGVTNIVLNNDIICAGGGYNFYPLNEQDTYYSIDLNTHTFYGVMQFDATANDCSDLPYGIFVDIRNGVIDSVHGSKPLTMETISILGSNINIGLNYVEVVGSSSAMSTNGRYNGVDIVAKDCKFVAVGEVGNAGPAAYLPAGGTYDFTNCWFEGDVGINIKSGALELEHCHIQGNGTYASPVYASGKSSGEGSALVVSSTNGYHSSLSVNIVNSEFVSEHGYGLEEVSLAPEGQEAGYIATITVDKHTSFKGGLGEYVSQNDAIKIESDAQPVEPEETTVRLTAMPSDEELAKYVKDGKKLIIVEGESSEYRIEVVSASEETTMEKVMSSGSNKYIVINENNEQVEAFDVAHSVDEIESLINKKVDSFIAFGIALNQIPASLLDGKNYLIEQSDEASSETPYFAFMKVSSSELGEGFDLPYEGRTIYLALTNSSDAAAIASITSVPEGVVVKKQTIIKNTEGYIEQITLEEVSGGLEFEAGQTYVLVFTGSSEQSTITIAIQQ